MSNNTLSMQKSFTVNRKVEDCFEYITDFSTIWEWDHTIKSSRKLSKGKIGIGTQFEVILKFGIQTVPMLYEITEYNYPHYAVLKGKADNFIAIDKVTIKKSSDNTVKVLWEAEIEFKGVSAKLFPLMEGYIKKGGEKTIDGLEEALRDDYKLVNNNSLADKLVLPGIWNFSKYGYNKARKRWNPVSTSVRGKHILITGATSGIGLAAAYELAHKGAILTLVARDKSKAEKLKSDIEAQTGNKQIYIEIADMSLIQDVKNLANKLLQKDEAIDVLINNAGALFNERQITSEGLEKSFALLLLSPFIFTEMLIPLLKNSNQARVINVSSGGMYSQKIDVADLQNEKGKYNGSIAYAKAKRGLVISTEQWAEIYKNDGIIFHSMHPGWADTQGVIDALPGFYKTTKNILRTPEQGADTIVWLAVAKEANQENGKFFLDREIHTTHLLSKTKESQEERELLRKILLGYLEL